MAVSLEKALDTSYNQFDFLSLDESSMLLEEWLSTPLTDSKIASAAPIIAATITLEAIQSVLHANGFPIEAPNWDAEFGPFDDTQFDIVVDVETTTQEKLPELKDDKLQRRADLDLHMKGSVQEQHLSKELLDQYEESLPDCSDISDLSEDDVMSILPDMIISESELDLSNDSGIEAEMEDMQDGADSNDDTKKMNKSDKNKDRNQKNEMTLDEGKKSCDKCRPSPSKSEQGRRKKSKDDDEDSPVKGCQYLWEFLHFLLTNKKYEQYIAWKNPHKGIFRMVDHNGVAKLWGKHKKRKNMTYDKLSRALRYYYSKNILAKVNGQRLTYKFCRNPSGKKYPS